MTTQVEQANALFSAECANASDAGFKMVAAGALAFIANHALPKGDADKLNPKDVKERLLGIALEAHKKTHAADLVNAAWRAAKKVWDEKQLLATVAASATIQDAATLVAAELKVIASGFAPNGAVSLRALFEALKPAEAKKRQTASFADRAVKAIEKCDPLDGLTMADIERMEAAIAGLRQALAASEAQEQVAQLADLVTRNDDGEVTAVNF